MSPNVAPESEEPYCAIASFSSATSSALIETCTLWVRRSNWMTLARDRSEQRPDRFAVGQKVDARVIQFDRRSHKVQVSIKALEVAEEKEAIAQYGSSDSGATLGDILGTALKRKGEEETKE